MIDLEHPVIVLAVPRSGSQLLRALLNAHPQLFVAAYSNLLGELSNPKIDWQRMTEMLQYEHDDSRRTPEHLVTFLRQLQHSFWTTSAERAWLGKPDCPRWGFLHYAVPPELTSLNLKSLFPDAAYLHIVRDGRDVVASWLANWAIAAVRMPVRRRDATAVAELWVRWLEAAKGYAPLTVRLEDLHAPERRAYAKQKILAHCGLGADPAIDAFVTRMPYVNAEKQTTERWRQDLDAETLEQLYAVPGFAATLEACGYVTS